MAELGEVGADLAEYRVGSDSADPGNVCEVDAKDPIKFFPEIERGFIVLALIGSFLGALRQLSLRLICRRQSFEVVLDFLIDIGNHLLVTAIPRERLLEREEMLWTIISLQRLGDLVFAALDTAVA